MMFVVDVICIIKQPKKKECFPLKKRISSAHLRYVQLFSNSITIQLMFIQRRYMKTIRLMNIIYLTHSDVFATAHYSFLGNNYLCRPHISLIVQNYEDIIKESLWTSFSKI